MNPIDFENCEGNLGLSNSLLRFMVEKLPVSRMQRDLSDSTVLRNLGTAFGYAVVAWDSALRGLGKISPNTRALSAEMESHWEVTVILCVDIVFVYRCCGCIVGLNHSMYRHV